MILEAELEAFPVLQRRTHQGLDWLAPWEEGSEEVTDLRIQSKCHMVPYDSCGKMRVRERVVLSDLKSCLDSRL